MFGVFAYIRILKIIISTDDRPGRVFRECDHVYEKLFGYDAFKTSEDGCRKYDVKHILGWYAEEDKDKVKDSTVTGILCVCSDDLCNGGPVSLTAMSSNTNTTSSSP